MGAAVFPSFGQKGLIVIILVHTAKIYDGERSHHFSPLEFK